MSVLCLNRIISCSKDCYYVYKLNRYWIINHTLNFTLLLLLSKIQSRKKTVHSTLILKQHLALVSWVTAALRSVTAIDTTCCNSEQLPCLFKNWFCIKAFFIYYEPVGLKYSAAKNLSPGGIATGFWGSCKRSIILSQAYWTMCWDNLNKFGNSWRLAIQFKLLTFQFKRTA